MREDSIRISNTQKLKRGEKWHFIINQLYSKKETLVSKQIMYKQNTYLGTQRVNCLKLFELIFNAFTSHRIMLIWLNFNFVNIILAKMSIELIILFT